MPLDVLFEFLGGFFVGLFICFLALYYLRSFSQTKLGKN